MVRIPSRRRFLINPPHKTVPGIQPPKVCDLDNEWYGEFGRGLDDTNDQFTVPVCIDFIGSILPTLIKEGIRYCKYFPFAKRLE